MSNPAITTSDSPAQVVKKVRARKSHPPTPKMVDASLMNLKERSGSSLFAIKKYITNTYKCDAQKLAPYIKKYLKTAVASGKLIQTKGKGALGSFKLSASAKKEMTSKSATVGKKTKKVSAEIAPKKEKKPAVNSKAPSAADKES